jgi:hypothetical protein
VATNQAELKNKQTEFLEETKKLLSAEIVDITTQNSNKKGT